MKTTEKERFVVPDKRVPRGKRSASGLYLEEKGFVEAAGEQVLTWPASSRQLFRF